MASLNNRHILLGVSGGIAAYKSAELIRRLRDKGADVRVVMTRAAQEFITPLTLQALSGNPVHTSLLDLQAEAAMGHIELARWADLILIAPASADLIARLASGQADDLLTAVCLASAAPLAIAPAMNQQMWHDPATTQNLQTLANRGIRQFGPAAGSQACGDVGLGRMLEADELAMLAAEQFATRQLEGIRVVISAGPTREAIDPVRYISNHSSGKMGFALARAAIDAGATVTLIAGPVALATPELVTRINVESANQMHQQALALTGQCDIFIGAAAVADYRPQQVASQKIKKSGEQMTIELVRNVDIIKDIASQADKPFCVGFAAETERLNEHAQGKLASKNLDLVIANDVSNAAIGFNSDDNAVTVFWREGQQTIPQASKPLLAAQLISLIAERYGASKAQ